MIQILCVFLQKYLYLHPGYFGTNCLSWSQLLLSQAPFREEHSRDRLRAVVRGCVCTRDVRIHARLKLLFDLNRSSSTGRRQQIFEQFGHFM